MPADTLSISTSHTSQNCGVRGAVLRATSCWVISGFRTMSAFQPAGFQLGGGSR